MTTDWEMLWPEGSARDKAWQVIVEIAAEAVAHSSRGNSGSTSYCDYEWPLLAGYLACGLRDEDLLESAVSAMNVGIDRPRSSRYLSLFGGLSGLGWSAQHLGRLVDFASDKVFGYACADVEPAEDDGELARDLCVAVTRAVDSGQWSGHFDLIDGLAGFGLFFLECLPAPEAREGLEVVLAKLDALSVSVPVGIAWHTSPDLLPEWQRQTCPSGYFNLGVAHGVPAVIHLLSEAVAAGASGGRAASLLDGAVAWLIAQRRGEQTGSYFPGWYAGDESTISRLGWCYGDLGIAIVLTQAACRHGVAEWEQHARATTERCLAKTEETSLIVDAGLCHGAAGAGHIFRRLYELSRDPNCRRAADYWLRRALDFRKPGSGVAGYSAVRMATEKSPREEKPSATLLEGAIGIALALLAAVSPISPDWDRMLLLSGRDWNRVPQVCASSTECSRQPSEVVSQ